MELIYSSLDDFEQVTAVEIGLDGFNSDTFNPSFDDRSDDKGPEPEALVVGKCTIGHKPRVRRSLLSHSKSSGNDKKSKNERYLTCYVSFELIEHFVVVQFYC